MSNTLAWTRIVTEVLVLNVVLTVLCLCTKFRNITTGSHSEFCKHRTHKVITISYKKRKAMVYANKLTAVLFLAVSNGGASYHNESVRDK